MENDFEPFDIIELDIKKMARYNLFWTFFLMIAFFFINALIYQSIAIHITLWDFLLFAVLYISLIILHEACHLIGFMLFGKVPFNRLEYGVNLKMGVAYATTKELLSNSAMKKALLLPFWITGVIPTVIGFIIDSNLWLFLGAWLIAGAIGDFMMYAKLRKYPQQYLVKDDPNLPRLYIYKV